MSEPTPAESLYGHEPPPETVRAPDLMEQIAGVFTEPVALFRRLAVTPVWGGALALMAVLNATVIGIWALRVDADALFRPALLRNPRVTAENLERILALQSKFLLPGGVIGGTLALGASLCLMALIFWWVGLATSGEHRPTYRHTFSATVVSGLVGLPKFLILGMVCAMRNFGASKPEALSPTSLGFFLVPENPRLHALACALDLFTVAGFAMLYLALRHTARLKPLGAALCVALSSLLVVGFALLGAR